MSQMTNHPVVGSSRVQFQVDNGVAVVTLNNPSRRNVIDDQTRNELALAIDTASASDDVHSLILTGAGQTFCAGGDIRAMQERLSEPLADVADNGWRRQRRIHKVLTNLHTMEKPTVAAVNGPAVGLGCDLALCCDFVVASELSSFAMSYVLRGLIPDGGGMYLLPRRVGLAQAKALIFSGRRIWPDEALAMGLADRVVPADGLLASARSIVNDFAGHSQLAIALSKTIVNRTFELTMEDIFALGAEAQAICYTSQPHRDAVAKFLGAPRDSHPEAEGSKDSSPEGRSSSV